MTCTRRRSTAVVALSVSIALLGFAQGCSSSEAGVSATPTGADNGSPQGSGADASYGFPPVGATPTGHDSTLNAAKWSSTYRQLNVPQVQGGDTQYGQPAFNVLENDGVAHVVIAYGTDFVGDQACKVMAKWARDLQFVPTEVAVMHNTNGQNSPVGPKETGTADDLCSKAADPIDQGTVFELPGTLPDTELGPVYASLVMLVHRNMGASYQLLISPWDKPLPH